MTAARSALLLEPVDGAGAGWCRAQRRVARGARGRRGRSSARCRAPTPRCSRRWRRTSSTSPTMVTEYRGTARADPEARLSGQGQGDQRQVRPADRPQRREAREYRRDAIAMFEAFLLKYPNDKRWTPDAMFRLAELYYEKSAEEYLDADEAYKKALDRPNPPDTPPPRVDYTPTINLYRRLLTEFPSYRFLDARLLPPRLLPRRDGRGRSRPSRRCSRSSARTNTSRSTRRCRRRSRRRARRAPRPTPTTRTSTRSARRSGRSRSSSPRRGRASASSTSTTRTS